MHSIISELAEEKRLRRLQYDDFKQRYIQLFTCYDNERFGNAEQKKKDAISEAKKKVKEWEEMTKEKHDFIISQTKKAKETEDRLIKKLQEEKQLLIQNLERDKQEFVKNSGDKEKHKEIMNKLVLQNKQLSDANEELKDMNVKIQMENDKMKGVIGTKILTRAQRKRLL